MQGSGCHPKAKQYSQVENTLTAVLIACDHYNVDSVKAAQLQCHKKHPTDANIIVFVSQPYQCYASNNLEIDLQQAIVYSLQMRTSLAIDAICGVTWQHNPRINPA